MRGFGFFIIGLSAQVCLAQPQDKSAEVKRLKARAETQYNEGNFRRSISLLEDAYALSKDPELLYALGRCYAELSLWSEATQSFELYLLLAPNGALRKEATDDLRSAQKKQSGANEALLLARETLVAQMEPIRQRKQFAGYFFVGGGASALLGAGLFTTSLLLANKSQELLAVDFDQSEETRQKAQKFAIATDIVAGISLSAIVTSTILYQRATSLEKKMGVSTSR